MYSSTKLSMKRMEQTAEVYMYNCIYVIKATKVVIMENFFVTTWPILVSILYKNQHVIVFTRLASAKSRNDCSQGRLMAPDMINHEYQ